MTSLIYSILGWVLPIVLGPLVYIVAGEVLNAHRRIDDLPPVFKRIAVVGLGTLIVAVLSALGIALPPECASLPQEVTEACAKVLSEPTVVRGVAAALVAMLLHKLRKAKPDYGRTP